VVSDVNTRLDIQFVWPKVFAALCRWEDNIKMDLKEVGLADWLRMCSNSGMLLRR